MLSRQLIDNLEREGVQAFVVCAGSRNFPLIEAICDSSTRKVFHHFEEREAAFFALGLAKKATAPICVVTTSGTAAAEVLPACIEAWYSSVPLVVVSADRPFRYRGTGAPQSIEQRDLLTQYTGARIDCDASSLPEIKLSRTSPTHINICFEEGDARPAESKIDPSEVRNEAVPCAHNKAVDHFTKFLGEITRPLLIVGSIPQSVRGAVVNLARRMNIPVFAESLSGLREMKELDPLLIKGGEKSLLRGSFDAAIRIGGVPTLRFWRDLEDRAIQVLSISPAGFNGMPGGDLLHVDFEEFFDALSPVDLPRFERDEMLFRTDERAVRELHALMYRFPKAEPALFHQLSHVVHEHDLLYLGNSLPIREWELCAARSRPHKIVYANRGANGIDGQLSTFFGSIDPMRHNWGVFGDLTTLYGSSAPWIVSQLGDVASTLVVINNSGGRIFERVASLQAKLSTPRIADTLLNKHGIRFDSMARMWGLEYLRTDAITPDIRGKGMRLVECLPDL